MNKFLFYGAIALLGASVSGCMNQDIDLSNVTPPEVEVAPNTLSGVITTKQGEPIDGATVSLGSLSATTNAEGIYEISDVPAGNYTVTASASGMISVEESMAVADLGRTQNLTWSTMLAKDIVETVNVTVAEGGEGEVTSEAIEGNDKAEIEVTVSVPANTVPENTTISISPIYTEESAIVSRASRATSETMLIGANITCSNPNLVLSNPLEVSFAVDETVTEHVVTKQYINGEWVEVDKRIEGEGVVVSTTQFGAIGLFFSVNMTTTKSSVALTFNPSSWDNLYGSNDIQAGSSTYNYRVGSDYNVSGANTLEALLIERLADVVGPTYKTVEGEYPINTTVPVGTAISISGSQSTEYVVISSRNREVSGTKYGTVTVQVVATNREHNGGAGGSGSI